MSDSPDHTPPAADIGKSAAERDAGQAPRAVSLTLSDGQPGTALGWDGSFLRVRLPVPFAPGAPVRVVLALDSPLPVEGKALGSKRGADGWFDVRLRPVTLPKSSRLALDALRNS